MSLRNSRRMGAAAVAAVTAAAAAADSGEPLSLLSSLEQERHEMRNISLSDKFAIILYLYIRLIQWKAVFRIRIRF